MQLSTDVEELSGGIIFRGHGATEATAAALWEVLTYPRSKIGRSVSDPGMHASERSGARNYTRGRPFRVACVLTFRAPPGRFDVGMRDHL